MQSQYDASSHKYNLCSVARQIPLPAYTQAAVQESSQDPGLMSIETHRDMVYRWCSITTWGVMDILPGKPF